VLARDVLPAQKFDQFASLRCLAAAIDTLKQYKRTSFNSLAHSGIQFNQRWLIQIGAREIFV
jgi:hypothetical protein